MDNEQKEIIFTADNESDANQAADYLKECNIECQAQKNDAGDWELVVGKSDARKAQSLLDDLFPPEEDEDSAEEEWEEEPVTSKNFGVVGVLGILLVVATAITAIIGYSQNWAQVKLVNIILGILSILVNGYVGIIRRKSLATAFCIISICALIFFVLKPAPPSSLDQNMNQALRLMNQRDYPAALQLYEQALEQSREEQDSQKEAFILSYMANIFKERNLIDRSLEHYQMALDLFISIGLEDMKNIIQPEIDKIKAEYGR